MFLGCLRIQLLQAKYRHIFFMVEKIYNLHMNALWDAKI